MRKVEKVLARVSERGWRWTLLFSMRRPLARLFPPLVERIDKKLIQIESEKFLIGEDVISSVYHTASANREIWNSWDWSKGGEEWTDDVKNFRTMDPHQWKTDLIQGLMLKYVKSASVVMEVGPGAGRWTEELLRRTQPSDLLLADIAQTCLDVCRDKFRDHDSIQYHLIRLNEGMPGIPSSSVDYIWSYDVFVHINPTDTARYIAEFARVLKPEGIAIIHHPGTYPQQDEGHIRSMNFRSYTNGSFFRKFILDFNLKLLEQDGELPHFPGDLVTVFQK